MRDSVPSPRYSPVWNVLRQWKTSLIPTYRVYRLYAIDILTIIINFHYTCISSFLAAASLLLCSFFKMFFVLVYVIFVQYIANVTEITFEIVQKIEIII